MERDPPMRLNPESLNPFLCTHIVYLQAQLDPKNNEVIPAKPSLDLKGGELIQLGPMKIGNLSHLPYFGKVAEVFG